VIDDQGWEEQVVARYIRSNVEELGGVKQVVGT